MSRLSKTIIVFITALSWRIQILAQSNVQVISGISINHLQQDDIMPETKSKDGPGYNFGLAFSRQLTNWLSIKSGLNLIEKNYTLERLNSFKGIVFRNSNQYLQAPVLVMIGYGEKWHKSIEIGFYTSYWMNGRMNANIPDVFSPIDNDGIQKLQLIEITQSYEFNKQRDKRWENGYVFGINISRNISKSYVLLINPQYYYSITDQQKKYMNNQTKRYNQTLVLNLGLQMSL